MKRLLVIRHAQAEASDKDDQSRPLTALGQASAQKLASEIQQAGFIPQLVLVSTAVRAAQTWQALATSLQYPTLKIQNAVNLYQGRLYDVLKLIQSLSNSFERVIIIGHNPILLELLNHLGDKTLTHLGECGAYRLDFDVDTWADIELTKAQLNAIGQKPNHA